MESEPFFKKQERDQRSLSQEVEDIFLATQLASIITDGNVERTRALVAAYMQVSGIVPTQDIELSEGEVDVDSPLGMLMTMMEQSKEAKDSDN
jgi:hypothetical protein